MDSRKLPLIVIVGPTASGKSALAVRLAKRFNGEIISADSRQVYRGLDLGTGKISKRAMRAVPHHLLDVAAPRRQCGVVEFQRRADRAIRDIASRGKLPFLVGGTAFWIDAVAHGVQFPPVPPQPTLRRRLARKSAADLLARLARLDPDRARTIESGNPRRLIRAIEIAKMIGQTPKVKSRMPYRTLWIGVAPPPQALRRRIRNRLAERIRRGMIGEARRLRAHGLAWRRFYELGLEYRFLADYLRGRTTLPLMRADLESAISRYARRQLAWWKRNKHIRWLGKPADAERLIAEFIWRETPRARGARAE